MVDSRGGKQSARLRRSEVSTDDLTALGLGCQPCASAQGANPPPPTTQKALTFVSAFCIRVGRGRFKSPQGELWRVAASPAEGSRLRETAVNTPSHALYLIILSVFVCPFCVGGRGWLLKVRQLIGGSCETCGGLRPQGGNGSNHPSMRFTLL